MTRILVIEDTELVREGIREKLQLNGYTVILAQDGLEGLQLAREHLPDLIICDVMMPELDGFAVIQELRSDSMTATIPFIFLTAKSQRPDQRLGMELGADDYLTKPFKESELIGAIKSRLNKRAALEAHQLRALTRKSLQLRENEHRILAHKIHDNIAQPLAGLKLSLHQIEHLPQQSLEEKILDVQSMVDQILSQVSASVHDVWPLILDDLGLLAALHQLFEQFYTYTQIKVQFAHNGLDDSFSHDIKITSYRIVEEALLNVARFAQVSVVKVTIWTEENILQIDIEDEGQGFDIEVVANMDIASGLVEMNERILQIGGDLSILSELGAGVRILASLPLTEADSRDALEGDPVSTIAFNSQTRFSNNGDRQASKMNPSASPQIQILIAEENHIIREGLKGLLEGVTGFVISGEATQRDQVLRMLRDLNPDILILGITLSGVSTLDLIRPARDFLPELQILIFSSHANEMYSYEASRRGASGYVLNNIRSDELIEAVKMVGSGQEYWSIPLSEESINRRVESYSTGDTELSKYATLTSREREILPMIAEGKTSKQIATTLSISPRTVETHRTRIGSKLGLRTQAELIRYALQHELIVTDSG